jgi:hypothetical protein
MGTVEMTNSWICITTKLQNKSLNGLLKFIYILDLSKTKQLQTLTSRSSLLMVFCLVLLMITSKLTPMIKILPHNIVMRRLQFCHEQMCCWFRKYPGILLPLFEWYISFFFSFLSFMSFNSIFVSWMLHTCMCYLEYLLLSLTSRE